jgi:hypothetical protein
MAENKILKNITSVYTDKSINGWLRGAIWVGTGILLYVGGKAIYKAVFPSDAEKKAKDDVKQRENELQQALQTQQLSFPLSQYNTWADTIAESMKGCDYGEINPLPVQTSFDTIRRIFKELNNDADYLQLYKSFGIRTIPKHWWCGGDYTNLDMAQCIGHQLTGGELEGTFGITNSGINLILESKGIKYRITSI